MTNVIGWAIIHSIWQAGVVAAATASLLFVCRNASAATRYRIAVLGLLMLAVVPIVTVARTPSDGPMAPATSGSTTRATVSGSVQPAQPVATATENSLAPSTANRSTATVPTMRERIERVIPWIVVAWLIGVLLYSARTISGYVWARRLASNGTRAVNDQLRGAAARIADNMGVRVAVRVLESSRVSVPMVVGWMRPVILMPASMLTGLMPQQIEAILAHELAHVRRNDYLVNVLQTIVETVYFYHPAAWWLSGRIREERENACDELAVAACGGDAVFYSRVLLTVEESRGETSLLAVAANGGSLSRRIHRLLGVKQAHLDIGPRWYAGVFTIALAMVTGGGLVDDRLGAVPSESFAVSQDTTRARPSAVLKATDGGTLEERWTWAETQARRNGYDRYWVGYLIDGDATGQTWLHYDRHTPVTMSDATMMGNIRMQGSVDGVRLPGIPLGSVVGEHEPFRVAVFIGYDRGKLARVHLASFAFPMSFDRAPLLWLGRASDAESVARIARLDDQAGNSELRAELTGFVGAHNDASAAVPVLERWALDRGRPVDARSEATESLQHFSSPRTLAILARIARNDPAEDVRADAIESIGGLSEPAALDTLEVFARTLTNERLQNEAVEALGNLPGARGAAALRAIVDDRAMRSHVRVDALESLVNRSESPDVIATLVRYTEADDVELQEEAVEAIANANASEDARLEALMRVVNSHRDPHIQGRAAETIGNLEAGARPIAELSRIARTHSNMHVRRRAIEGLSNFAEDERGARVLMEMADADDQDIDVRRAAVESYMTHAEPSSVVAFARRLLASDAPFDVRREVLEALGSVDDGAGIPLIIEVARTTNDNEIRRRAIEALIESDHPRAVEALKNIR